MSAIRPTERVLIARLAAHESWARTTDPAARTAPARKAAADRFEKQVDPDGILPPAARARLAESARKAFFTRLALKSAQARRARRNADVLGAETVDTPARVGNERQPHPQRAAAVRSGQDGGRRAE